MVQVPRADPGQVCPLHKKDVSEVCHACPWWTKVYGKNPQSEQIIDNWACAVALLPLMLMENAQVSRGTTKAMETFRNSVVEAVGFAVDTANRRLTNGPPRIN
jgi:hypothetical protein